MRLNITFVFHSLVYYAELISFAFYWLPATHEIRTHNYGHIRIGNSSPFTRETYPSSSNFQNSSTLAKKILTLNSFQILHQDFLIPSMASKTNACPRGQSSSLAGSLVVEASGGNSGNSGNNSGSVYTVPIRAKSFNLVFFPFCHECSPTSVCNTLLMAKWSLFSSCSDDLENRLLVCYLRKAITWLHVLYCCARLSLTRILLLHKVIT